MRMPYAREIEGALKELKDRPLGENQHDANRVAAQLQPETSPLNAGFVETVARFTRYNISNVDLSQEDRDASVTANAVASFSNGLLVGLMIAERRYREQ